MVLTNNTKVCSFCKAEKTADSFYVKKPGLLESKCKACKKQKRQEAKKAKIKKQQKKKIKNETTPTPKKQNTVQVQKPEELQNIEELKSFFKFLIKMRRKYKT
ncbi:MAG: hypothetical protein ACRBBP_03430 [Bdellovibrionales bacterium]